MTVAIAVDGAEHSGHWRIDCECGRYWLGPPGREYGDSHTPNLAVTTAIAHASRAHAGEWIDLDFTQRFCDWMASYARRHHEERAWRRRVVDDLSDIGEGFAT